MSGGVPLSPLQRPAKFAMRNRSSDDPQNVLGNLLVALARNDGEKAEFLRELFATQDFEGKCMRLGLSVDKNRSDSIDRAELYEAFKTLVNDMPGACATQMLSCHAGLVPISVTLLAAFLLSKRPIFLVFVGSHSECPEVLIIMMWKVWWTN